MAWPPENNQPVNQNEAVGRRIFDKPVLAGAKDQKPLDGLDPRHFMEKRSPELSLDLLGKSGCDRKVIDYLRIRAQRDATRRHGEVFHGWAVLQAKKFSSPPAPQ